MARDSHIGFENRRFTFDNNPRTLHLPHRFVDHRMKPFHHMWLGLRESIGGSKGGPCPGFTLFINDLPIFMNNTWLNQIIKNDERIVDVFNETNKRISKFSSLVLLDFPRKLSAVGHYKK